MQVEHDLMHNMFLKRVEQVLAKQKWMSKDPTQILRDKTLHNLKRVTAPQRVHRGPSPPSPSTHSPPSRVVRNASPQTLGLFAFLLLLMLLFICLS